VIRGLRALFLVCWVAILVAALFFAPWGIVRTGALWFCWGCGLLLFYKQRRRRRGRPPQIPAP